MPGSRKLSLVMAVNTAGGVAPAVVMQLFRTNVTWRGFAGDLLYGLVYSHCIGALGFGIVARVAPRMLRLPRILAVGSIGATLIAAAVVGTVIANALFVVLGVITPAEFWQHLTFGLRISILSTLLIGSLVTIFEGLTFSLQQARLELRTRQLEEERARKLAFEARLSSLESRVHPHFLFNTLNSISALIREDPPRAERTVERLAALLRYSLDTGRSALVPLSQELHVVRNYLEIEKTRFGDRLRFTINAAPGIDDLEVPPMALQTLVENSIKHAVSGNRAGGEIRVFARLESGALQLEVSDDGPGFDLRAIRQGHGLENLQERLGVLFNGDGRLEIARRDGRMRVLVTVPQKKVLA